MTSPEFHVNFNSGVADVMAEANRMIAEARRWASGGQWAVDMDMEVLEINEWRSQYVKMQQRVNDMELSWLRSLVQLIQLASNAHDGDLQLFWDSETSLFFRHPKSGYHGALIFHPAHHNGQPLPIGSWSIHT